MRYSISTFNRSLLSLTVLAVSVFTFLSPVSAKSTNDLLNVQANQPVTRGDFLRAAVKALDLDERNVDESVISEYLRVPRGYQNSVSQAHERDALGIFGNDLMLGRPIKRGEAVRLVLELGDFDPVVPTVSLRDVRSGSSVEGAVGVSIKLGWLDPIRDGIFGVSRVLQGKDAIQIISTILGEEAPTVREQRKIQEKKDSQTIRLNFRSESNSSLGTFPKGDILNAVWQLVNKNYLYKEKVNSKEVGFAAAEAIMKSLDDPYSVFMRPASSRSFQSQIQGKVSGIGAQVEWKDEILTIVSPLPGSPAEKEGLKPGDQILEASGINLIGIGFMEAVEHVRGKEGTIVELKIRRSGAEFMKSVQRQTVTVPEIEITWQGEIAVVKLLQFGNLTDRELRPEMERIQEQNPKGIILDLRSNPGGLLHAANNVVSNFVPKGSPVAKVVAIDDERTEYTDMEPTIDMSIPVYVLMNGGSASASEIVAGALQDHERATVIGETSFGKGTVQQVLQFSDQSGVKMTVAEWFTPDGRKIDGVGVQPDIMIETDQRDRQMLKALELLR
ncbi:S41 family peptidase [Candidatus Peregrinibacteria bacterium]|nr:S41 family peptidase [Candidatus Peregrinibacteria bacterium]MBT3598663.1 S41 family peptidase [Candidatus Peregrinibacteria bacterium]MBT4366902.1 S41 family peptidase [Candidatus Peregrinibacteria bacterium]MBT4585328.1 S41 family peptidase [Candidatus Peregrinibacteria bacterium]MBT6730938.1 S41 family peptidase [Candidatus Peregrinibacteria bacterium]